MATEDQVQKVLNSLMEIRACRQCGTSIRFGDMDCPHCGADLEEELRRWAERLVAEIQR